MVFKFFVHSTDQSHVDHTILLYLGSCVMEMPEDVVVFDVYVEDNSNEVEWSPEGRLRAI